MSPAQARPSASWVIPASFLKRPGPAAPLHPRARGHAGRPRPGAPSPTRRPAPRELQLPPSSPRRPGTEALCAPSPGLGFLPVRRPVMDVAAAAAARPGPPLGSAAAGGTWRPFPGLSRQAGPRRRRAPEGSSRLFKPAALAASRPVPGKLAESSRVSQKRVIYGGLSRPAGPRGQIYLQVSPRGAPQTLQGCSAPRCALIAAAWRGRAAVSH